MIVISCFNQHKCLCGISITNKNMKCSTLNIIIWHQTRINVAYYYIFFHSKCYHHLCIESYYYNERLRMMILIYLFLLSVIHSFKSTFVKCWLQSISVIYSFSIDRQIFLHLLLEKIVNHWKSIAVG